MATDRDGLVGTGRSTEVARRTGRGVAVLLEIYAHCIDGQANAANKSITDALGTPRQSRTQAMKTTQATSRQPEVAGQRQGGR